jgi:hypothetical protein
MSCSSAWARAGTKLMSETVPVTRPETVIRFPLPPEHVAAYLVDKAGSMIDGVKNQDEPKRVTSAIPSKRELQRRILDGEGDMLEFKNYADPLKNVLHTQAQAVNVPEIAAQLVAFANTQGGILLIGVQDDTVMRGVDDVRKAKDKITEAAHDCCDPRLTPTLFSVKVDNQTIVGAIVEKGKTLHLARNVPYVRRNATTRKATAGEAADVVKRAQTQPGYGNRFGLPAGIL